MKIFMCALLIWNVAVMLIYGADKLRAKKGWRRTRETTLLTLALLMGGIGAAFGMILFNHKTSKMKFRIVVPLAEILNCAVVFLLYYYVVL